MAETLQENSGRSLQRHSSPRNVHITSSNPQATRADGRLGYAKEKRRENSPGTARRPAAC
jgi:hypothetical protein